MSSGDDCAAARLACSWLLTYPDDRLLARLDNITEVALAQPTATREPLLAFLAHVADTPCWHCSSTMWRCSTCRRARART